MDLVEDVLETDWLAPVASADRLDDRLKKTGDRDFLAHRLRGDLDGKKACREASFDEAREDFPWTADLSCEDVLDGVTLRLGGLLVDDHHLRPATCDHAMRRVIGDDDAAPG